MFISNSHYYKNAVRNIRSELQKYVEDNKIKSLVLGISGGIDSALCAALARPVCDELGIPLIGRSITIESNKKEEIDRAKMVGEKFCHNFREINLSYLYNTFQESFDDQEDFEDNFHEKIDNDKLKIIQGNVKARLRMIYLYDIAGATDGMVLSTDNYTEFLLGFWTLHGDVGDFGMVQNLWKTEVYNMADWICDNELGEDERSLALKLCIDANATDGLGVSQTDLDQILPDWRQRHANTRSGYVEVDQILNGEIEYLFEEQTLVLRRRDRTSFKRSNPYNIPKIDIMKNKE